MGWKTQAVIANLVIVQGPHDGVFVYNGTPAAGNLVASIVSQAGTDQYGNKVLNGITRYDNPALNEYLAADLFNGALSFLTATTEAGPYTQIAQLGTSFSGVMSIEAPQVYIANGGSPQTGANVEIDQIGNHTGLIVVGNNTALVPQFEVLDFAGNTELGVGIQGVYGIGDPFIVYHNHGSPGALWSMAMTPLADGLSANGGAGIQTYNVAESDLTLLTPVSGTQYLNWEGNQDGWSGVDQHLYLAMAAIGAGGNCQVYVGAGIILTSALTSGNTYTSLSVQALPGAIPGGTTLTLYGGGYPTPAFSQTITVAGGGAAKAATTIPVVSFVAGNNYPAFANLGGNKPTSWLEASAAAGFPWIMQLTEDVMLNGETRTIQWTTPWKWWFKLVNSGLTIGSINGLSV